MVFSSVSLAEPAQNTNIEVPAEKFEENEGPYVVTFRTKQNQSAYMLKGSLLQTSYMSTWFTAPKYATEFEMANGADAYKE